MKKETLLIINPVAGNKKTRRKIEPLIKKIRETLPSLEVIFTRGPGEATSLAREGVSMGMKRLICAGGDGTINEVINGMVGSDVPLAILPTGTGNGLVREIGLPLDPFAACTYLSRGRTKRISLGQVDGRRYFVLMAGVGLDAYATERIVRYHSALKEGYGMFTYVYGSLLALFSYPFPEVTFSVDGRPYWATTGVIARAKLYMPGPFPPFAPSASLEEASLTLCYYQGKRPLPFLRDTFLFFGGIRRVEYTKGQVIEASSNEKVPVHVDGELIGSLPMKFSVSEKTVPLLCP